MLLQNYTLDVYTHQFWISFFDNLITMDWTVPYSTDLHSRDVWMSIVCRLDQVVRLEYRKLQNCTSLLHLPDFCPRNPFSLVIDNANIFSVSFLWHSGRKVHHCVGVEWCWSSTHTLVGKHQFMVNCEPLLCRWRNGETDAYFNITFLTTQSGG